MNIWNVAVTVDENDADFLTEITQMDDKQKRELESIIEIAQKIGAREKEYWPGGIRWPSERDPREPTVEEIYPELSKEDIELVNDICPYAQYGFHTITRIVATPLGIEEVIL